MAQPAMLCANLNEQDAQHVLPGLCWLSCTDAPKPRGHALRSRLSQAKGFIHAREELLSRRIKLASDCGRGRFWWLRVLRGTRCVENLTIGHERQK